MRPTTNIQVNDAQSERLAERRPAVVVAPVTPKLTDKEFNGLATSLTRRLITMFGPEADFDVDRGLLATDLATFRGTLLRPFETEPKYQKNVEKIFALLAGELALERGRTTAYLVQREIRGDESTTRDLVAKLVEIGAVWVTQVPKDIFSGISEIVGSPLVILAQQIHQGDPNALAADNIKMRMLNVEEHVRSAPRGHRYVTEIARGASGT